MHLAELQAAFWVTIRALGSRPEYNERLFTASARQTCTARLGIYRRAHWQRQLGLLGDVFRRSGELLGAREFERARWSYLVSSPGEHPCIEHSAEGFVQHLANRAGVEARAVGVARLEFAMLEALLAPDASQILRIPTVGGLAFAAARLAFVPSLRVESVPRSALDTLQASEPPGFTAQAMSRRGRDPDGGEGSDARGTADAQGSNQVAVAVWRQGFVVRWISIADDELQALKLARSGATISTVCSAFAELSPAVAVARAQSALGAWFSRAWVSELGAGSNALAAPQSVTADSP